MIQQLSRIKKPTLKTKRSRKTLVPTPQCQALNKQGVQWDVLSKQETALLQDFLGQLEKNKAVRIFITPTLATVLLLALNWNNVRPLKHKRALHYANEIQKGNWDESYDMLAICDDLTFLINGQHRLTAIELSKQGVYLYVGLFPAPSAKSGDSGAGRSLKIRTQLSDKIVATTRNMNEQVLKYNGPISAQTVEAIYKEYQQEIDRVVNDKQLKPGGAISGALAYGLGQLNGQPKLLKKFETFTARVCDGTMVGPPHPAYITREWLKTVGQGSGKNRTTIFARILVAAYCFLHDTSDLDSIQDAEALKWFKDQDKAKTNVFQGYLTEADLH